MEGTILVATAGQGILRSSNNGDTWDRIPLEQAIEYDGVVRALAVDPHVPSRVFAGADVGLCVSEDGGTTWTRVDSPMNDMHVWSLAIDPQDPKNMLAGTGAPSRAALFSSSDNGKTWRRIGPEIPEFCQGVHRPRLLTVCIDPTDGRRQWFGLEEGGLFFSHDGGQNWERLDEKHRISSSDIHAIRIVPGPPKTVMVVVVNGVYRSEDDGKSWTGVNAKQAFGLRYGRMVAAKADSSSTLLLAIGDATPGTASKILRSRDLGKSWEVLPLPLAPNSTFWAFGVHPANPNLIFAGTKYGHLYRTQNGGDSWQREWREFSEITDIAWTPAQAKAAPGHHH